MSDKTHYNLFDLELQKRVAACKGFENIGYHFYHIVRKQPRQVWCTFIYDDYMELNCGTESNPGCTYLKKYLESDCQAECNGKYVHLRDKTLVAGPKEFDYDTSLNIMAELRGVDNETFLRMRDGEIIWKKLLRRLLDTK